MNIPRCSLTRLDVAGAFGDVAVLFPLAVGLISLNQMNPTAVFLAAGLAYILAGAYFGLPIPVQPLKAVAAIALALRFPPSTIGSAGLVMGLLLVMIGLTNLAPLLARLFTLPIIRGVQLGLGLLLAREGLRLLQGGSAVPAVLARAGIGAWMVGLAATAILLLLRGSRRFPAALVLLGAGAALGIVTDPGTASSMRLGPQPLAMLHLNFAELQSAFVMLVIPQFALTFGNAIVATENTGRLLYGPQARRLTVCALTISIGLMNLASGMLLAAPMCHGSGGMTAHYKFGARSAKSSYVIGGVCLILALFGRSAVAILRLVPMAVLGVFLIYVGIQHAAFLRDIIKHKRALLVAVLIGIVSLVTTNLTVGFVAGFFLEGAFLVRAKVRLGRACAGDSPEGTL